MSKEQVTAFFEKIHTDQALKKELSDFQNELHQTMMARLADKLVVLAANAGFAFTADDLRELHEDMMDKMNDNRELTTGELSAVAGGSMDGLSRGALITASIVTFGLYCAGLSIASELFDRNSCGGSLSIGRC